MTRELSKELVCKFQAEEDEQGRLSKPKKPKKEKFGPRERAFGSLGISQGRGTLQTEEEKGKGGQSMRSPGSTTLGGKRGKRKEGYALSLGEANQYGAKGKVCE